MNEFYGQLPEDIDKREDKEHLEWFGHDNSFEIFPHLNLDWEKLNKIYTRTRKPIGDLGSSFSTLPAEGELRGINILPIDIMHKLNESRYQFLIEKSFQNRVLSEHYNKGELKTVIQKVMDKYIIADLAKIPLADRSLSIAIAHDSLPKHSISFQTFLDKQLPEILRVTDQIVYMYPMSIYKVVRWQGRFDYQTGKDIWKKVSELTPYEIAEEKDCKSMDPEIYQDEYSDKTTLEESQALYKDLDSIKQITEMAEKMGFRFRLEKSSKTDKEERKEKGDIYGGGDPYERHEQQEATLGIFTRKS